MTYKFHFVTHGKSMDLAKRRNHSLGQQVEPLALLKLIANNFDCVVYLIGRSNFHQIPEKERKEMFPKDNIINANYGNDPTITITRDETISDYKNAYSNFLKRNPEVYPDMIYIISGISPPVRLTYKNHAVIHQGYSSPFICAIQELELPHTIFLMDPRGNLGYCKDLTVKPIHLLSLSHNPERYRALNEDIPTDYFGLGALFLTEMPKHQPIDYDSKVYDFNLICHNNNRGELLQEWVVDNFDDFTVYGGGWKDYENDDRFPGVVPQKELLLNVLPKTKCSFLIPIAEGWTTAKIFELAYSGVLPFLHPHYDSNRFLDIPEELRVKSPSELKEKIDYYSNISHKKEYISLLGSLRENILEDKYYNGSYFVEGLTKTMPK
ncbi:MAG: hypothetical protein R3321_02415 [Nitrososphaeraceae archaeon]|nr:hypothetical protein [Nitrososphaeraceae archaeon]